MKSRKTFYEWDIETLDANGDIDDHNFSDTCPGIPKEPMHRLVLVRDVYEWPENDQKRKCDPDLICRSWAYVVSGKLPEYFEAARGAKTVVVPKRFHAELAKAEGK